MTSYVQPTTELQDLIALNLSGAFNTDDCLKLLQQLQEQGIIGLVLEWLNSYLTCSKECVTLGQC